MDSDDNQKPTAQPDLMTRFIRRYLGKEKIKALALNKKKTKMVGDDPFADSDDDQKTNAMSDSVARLQKNV